MAAAYAFEIDESAIRVAGTVHPDVIQCGDILDVTREWAEDILRQYPHSVFFLSGGPPCKDVSMLNSGGKGAWGPQSKLREEYKRVTQYFLSMAPDRTRALMECTTMRAADRVVYGAVHGRKAFELCSKHFAPVTRRRWWWPSHEPTFPMGTTLQPSKADGDVQTITPIVERVSLRSTLLPGWTVGGPRGRNARSEGTFTFECLTTRERRSRAPRDPRGIEWCEAAAL